MNDTNIADLLNIHADLDHIRMQIVKISADALRGELSSNSKLELRALLNAHDALQKHLAAALFDAPKGI